ncbi:cytochrome C biogenesis protein [Candidatus Methylomirabilis lanthanidiphila]|uniref:Cytochrome C biogenesis protein n=1 Tax=Candidatus Methylomirabilis lanthanidiphila TaxID=2211376 RepID=A0A564ZNG2_9BACT|nr:cytochrome c biogenesis protein CcdA [Candidatus Methylomirabilis lanthanidiphila]VUZ86397.1 cytochrome C biogenesis protein [Candidatus Methylomirabilis lanthanidiphila]
MLGTGETVTIWMALGAGVLSFLSPCVLPIFPSYLSFVTGLSFGELSDSVNNVKTRRAIVLNALCFIFGFSVVFMSLGASFSLLGRLLFDYQQILRKVGGVLVILFGLYIAGFLNLPFLTRTVRLELQDRPAGYLGAFIVGVTFAAGWTPCVGPILGSILLYASTAKTAYTGILMLGAYSLGLAIPFFLSALALNRFLDYFDRFKRLIPVMSAVGGIFLIVVGGLLLTNYFTILSAYALRLTPQWLWQRL